METIENIENVKDAGSGIHGAPAERIESELSTETRVAMIKNALKIALRQTMEDLDSTQQEMEQAFNEIEEEGMVYEINTDKKGHA